MRLKCLLAVVCFTGCVTVKTVNIGQKTSLEKQLMGEFEPLSDEELLAASVRAGPQALATPLLAVQEAALNARERQLFNRDDMRALKQRGCLGEGLDAVLVARPCTAAAAEPGSGEALRDRLVVEENADRKTLIAWAQNAANQTASDTVGALVAVYHRLLAEAAAPGDAYQRDDGTWAQH